MKHATRAKVDGVHYTPDLLATFLAEETLRHLPPGRGPVRVLDPALGDGGLLRAIARTAPASLRRRLVLVGHETDAEALDRARGSLASAGVGEVMLVPGDFLAMGGAEGYDAIIANPPYVRTQVLGAARARALALRFGLTGRIDLAYAFVAAMTSALRPGGVLGLLTSNRFLVTQSGAAVRERLGTQFDLRAVYDLGDTRLFSAAVLPAIVVALKRVAAHPPRGAACPFGRVYSHRALGAEGAPPRPALSVLEALRAGASGLVETPGGPFLIERGAVARSARADGPWSLATPEHQGWLAAVEAHRACSFADVGRVRVGIKTTADRVFIRDDWDDLPPAFRPEPELLRPILTHRDADRWRPRDGSPGPRRVLYTHTSNQGRRAPIDLDEYPRARAYLLSRRATLEARTYVRKAGRRWYEIWVPQDPGDWPKPKVVFPDIAERPPCFLDPGGAVVNGDCYWIVLKPGVDPRWLPVMLAVANSSFALTFYDTSFHNKLYAGRRRFITQYVNHFPLPPLASPAVSRLVELVSMMTEGTVGPEGQPSLEREVDGLVSGIIRLDRTPRARRPFVVMMSEGRP
ncbi:MAG: N-6 DNA methylase [Singulisphaera sp.]